jgi:arsenate reductase
MAEALFNKIAEGQAVAVSAGDRPALKVDSRAIEVMKEIGIDIRKQRPKSLTMKMVEEADVVVNMGCGADLCPVIPKRVEEWKIEDPAGKPMQIFRKVRNEIKERVQKLVETLKNADR